MLDCTEEVEIFFLPRGEILCLNSVIVKGILFTVMIRFFDVLLTTRASRNGIIFRFKILASILLNVCCWVGFTKATARDVVAIDTVLSGE